MGAMYKDPERQRTEVRNAVRRLRARRRITKADSEFTVPRALRQRNVPRETMTDNKGKSFGICLVHGTFYYTCGCGGPS